MEFAVERRCCGFFTTFKKATKLAAQRWRRKINDKHSSIFIIIIIYVIITLWLFQVIALYDFKAATSIEP